MSCYTLFSGFQLPWPPSCCQYQPSTCGYFSLSVIIWYYHYLFCHSNHSSFGHWELLQVDCCVPLTWPHHFLNASLLSWHGKIFWACLLPSLPQAWNQYFLQSNMVPFRKQNLDQYLGSRYANRCWVLIAPRPSQQTELGNMSGHQPVHMNIPVFLCLTRNPQ